MPTAARPSGSVRNTCNMRGQLLIGLLGLRLVLSFPFADSESSPSPPGARYAPEAFEYSNGDPEPEGDSFEQLGHRGRSLHFYRAHTLPNESFAAYSIRGDDVTGNMFYYPGGTGPGGALLFHPQLSGGGRSRRQQPRRPRSHDERPAIHPDAKRYRGPRLTGQRAGAEYVRVPAVTSGE